MNVTNRRVFTDRCGVHPALTILLILACFSSIGTTQAATISFSFTGSSQQWVVPSGVTSVDITAFGAQGGAAFGGVPGGRGGLATGTMSVVHGELIRVNVGGRGQAYNSGGFQPPGGFNGGGRGGGTGSVNSRGGAGGGASDVRKNGASLANRVIVAGGGGGAGGYRRQSFGPGAGGGGGGGYYGGGGGGSYLGTGGSGGTQTSGGAAGLTSFARVGGQAGGRGALGSGGNGGIAPQNNQGGSFRGTPGGSGGGLVGQKAANASTSNWAGAGGGGGSSYIGGVSSGTASSGARSGHGLVIFRYLQAILSSSPLSGSVLDFGVVTKGSAPVISSPISLENVGDAGSELRFEGASLLGSGFSLFRGNPAATLISDGSPGFGSDFEELVFRFDPSGLGEGTHQQAFTLSTNAGDLNLTLSAVVSVPEASTISLAVLTLVCFQISRRRRPNKVRS